MFAVLSSFVYAIDCNVWSCDPDDYALFDKTNPTWNGSTVSGGDSIYLYGWTAFAGGTQVYNTLHNTSPVSVEGRDTDEGRGYFNIDEKLDTSSFNATCLDFLYSHPRSSASLDFTWDYGSDFNARVVSSGDCTDNNICYNTGSWIATGISHSDNKWMTACVYWDGTYQTLYISNRTDSWVSGPIAHANWDSWFPANGGIYPSRSEVAGKHIYIDNIRVFNASNIGDEGIAIELDLDPPTITNAICLDCISNTTLDPTITINFTCIDALNSCTGLRCSNNSGFNFSNASSTRDASQGIGNDWVFTLPESDKLTNKYVPQPIYCWANDTDDNYHTNFNISIDITLLNEPPNVPTVTSPVQDEVSEKIKIEYNASNEDSITYNVYINGTLNSSSTANISIWNATVGFYSLEVSAFDGINSSANSSAITFNKVSARNVSGEHVDVHFDAFVLDVGDYVVIGNFTFNLTSDRDTFFKGEGNVKKETQNPNSDVSMRITVNDVVKFDEVVISVDNTDEHKVFTIPPFIDRLTLGENRIAIEMKEEGIGTIRVSSLKIHAVTNRTNKNRDIELDRIENDFILSSTSYTNQASYTINKTTNSTVLLNLHVSLKKTSGGSSATPECYLISANTTERTVTMARYLSGLDVVGSSGINFRSETPIDGIETWNLFCKSSNSDNIQINTTMIMFNLVDDRLNIINGFHNNTLNTSSYSGANNKILSFEDYVVKNGTEVEISSVVYYQSTTGAQQGTLTPSIKLNATGLTEDDCFIKLNRSVENNNDIATVKFYVSCKNVVVDQSYSFNLFLDLDSGETLNVLNASMDAIELDELIVNMSNVPPIVALEFPAPGDNISKNMEIIASVVDLNNDSTLSNITLDNSSSRTFIATDLIGTNTSFNTSTIGDGKYNLTWTAFENETSDRFKANDTHEITIDNTELGFSNFETNATDGIIIQKSVQFNVTIKDNLSGVARYIFSWNDSGWVNFSFTFNGGTSVKALVNKTITNSGAIGYRWYANDSAGNLNVSQTFTFLTSGEFIELNGENASRTYEYETLVSITTNLGFIDILDDTFRFINTTGGFLDYSIDILRQNKFNDTNTSKNISSGNRGTVNLDNRTDLYNATVNLTGINNPENVTFNSSSQEIKFPGTLIGNNLYQDKFISSGIIVKTVNVSLSTAGTQVIFVNFSSHGNLLTRDGYLNFTLTAFDLDIGNDLDFTENFTNSDNINLSTLLNTSAPFSVFDDLESRKSNRWICTNVSSCSASQCDCFLSTGQSDDYFKVEAVATWTTSDASTSRLDYNAPEITLSNISAFNISASWGRSFNVPFGHFTSGIVSLFATDNTNTVLLVEHDFSVGSGTGTSQFDVTLHGFKNSDNEWILFENSTALPNPFPFASLNEPISLRWEVSVGGDHSDAPGTGTLTGFWWIYNINTTGLRLKRLNGTYEINVVDGCFETNNISVGQTNIRRALFTATVDIPGNTTGKFFLSNDRGVTFEEVILGDFHTFTSTGNKLKGKVCFNSTNNITSPFIADYRFQIIPAAPSGLTIDVGQDGIIDMTFSGELNLTTTPLKYTGNDTGINDYINNSCQGLSQCTIPIVISLGSPGLLEFSNFNLTENINPIKLNVSIIQNLNRIPFSLSYQDGTVNLNDIRLDFRGSKNITIVAHNFDSSTKVNNTIRVKYSPFNLTFPSIATAWEIFPFKKNQSNIQPFGQNNTHGIFEIKSLAYDNNVDIYVRYNNTENITCVTKQEFRGRNYSFGQADGLVAYYKFDENSSRDYSRNNNDGIVSGAFWNSTGGVNNSGGFEFDGVDDSINISNSPSLNFSGKNLTILAWIYDPPPERETIKRTSSTETICSNGKCNLVLYSGTRFVNEDNEWKDVKDVRSLKGIFNIKYLKNDNIHDFEIVNLNYTSIELKVFVKDSKELNKDIPFKVDNIQKTTKRLTSLTDKSTVTFTSDNILASNYTFGSKSTTIILQDADSETLDDTRSRQDAPNNNAGSSTILKINSHATAERWGFWKFNITAIPSNQDIENATLNLYLAFNNLDVSGEGYNISIHRIFQNYTISGAQWNEDTVNWDNNPSITEFNAIFEDTKKYFGGAGEPLGWQIFTVTSAVSADYGAGNLNTSFLGFPSDIFGSPDGVDSVQFRTKEHTTASQRPYLNITYTPPPTPLAVNITKMITSKGNSFQFGLLNELNLSVMINTTNVTATGPIYKKWYHVVLNFNGTHINLFMDNVLNNSVAYSGDILSDNSNLYIGSNGTGRFFNGTIDEVAIYDRSLSAQEINNIYRNQVQYFSNLTITNLTINNQKIIENIEDEDIQTTIFSFTNINCSAVNSKLLIPYFCFNSLCVDCVKTQDFQDNCETVE